MPNRTTRAAALAAPAVPVIADAPVTPETPAITADDVKAAREAATAARETAKAALARAKELTKAAKAAKVDEPKAPTATDYRREIDLMIITKAGELVEEHVPAEHRAEVAVLIANQLHHLSTPKLGWPSVLPKPDRSDWRTDAGTTETAAA